VIRTHGQALSSLALLLTQVWLPMAGLTSVASVQAVQTRTEAEPALMLPKVWQLGHNPAGFLISEKFDGVRAFWDGQKLRFRSGRPIAAPDWFTAALPKTALDGELWLARGQFDRLSATVRRSDPVDAQWREVRYLVFDAPGAGGTFSERIKSLAEVVQTAGQSWLQVVPQQRLDSAVALQAHLKQLVAEGGEGLVLHRANALWSPGRSDALLKLKPSPDEDAKVVAHLPGKGRHAGHLGALLLELPDGQRFALGTGFSDAQRAAPPAVGTVVTYRYRDRTLKGLPRFASFLRVREAE